MRTFYLLLCVLVGIFYSTSGLAARVYSTNTIWFDSSNNVIGQSAYYCNNAHVQGGQQSGAYSLTIQGGCGDQTFACSPTYDANNQATGYYCVATGYNQGVTAKLFGNYGTVTIQQACGITNACTFQEPELMTDWGFPLGN